MQACDARMGVLDLLRDGVYLPHVLRKAVVLGNALQNRIDPAIWPRKMAVPWPEVMAIFN